MDFEKLSKIISDFEHEIISYLLGFGFAKGCYDAPIILYETNVVGSVLLMELLIQNVTD